MQRYTYTKLSISQAPLAASRASLLSSIGTMAFSLAALLSFSLCANAAFAQRPSNYAPKTCTVASKYASSNGTADDSPAIASAFAKCADGGTVVFSEDVDYNVFTPITATNLSGTTIEVYGNLHLPQNITAVQELFNETTYASGSSNLYWFAFSGRARLRSSDRTV